MKTSRLIFRSALLLVFCLLSTLACLAQSASPMVETLLILPFENRSKSPGLEWIGESFPELLAQRLASPSLYVISREDRVYAFDRLGIPATTKPSRATSYRIAEQMDCDYMVTGSFEFDGLKLTARAQVLNMRKLRQSSQLEAAGPLPQLVGVQTELAWQLLKAVQPQTTISREDLLRSADPVRLDSFESYVRGIVATTRQEKVQRFREAIRLNPQYTRAMLQLGKTYYANKEYESAAQWLARIPQGDKRAGEAYFLLGMSTYYMGQFDRSEDAFKVTVGKLPLTEVYNNLGAVGLRRGRRTALQYLKQALDVDPNDPDYRYNYAIALYRWGDAPSAIRNLKESLARYPTDSEARQFLDEISTSPSRAADASATTQTQANVQSRLPMPRLKRNYDENSFRMLAMEIQNAAKKAPADNRNERAAYLVRHGMELLDRGLAADAEQDFLQAITAEPTSWEAHLGLALAAENRGDVAKARQEAASSINLHPAAAAYLVLARADLKQKQLPAAQTNVEKALQLEAANADALSLKQQIEAQRAKALEPSR